MCRFALYLGPPIRVSSLVTEPTHSIIHQSYRSREREEPLNGDGFGVAWYAPEITDTPAVFRDISPAWSNMNLVNVAEVSRSGCIMAHVRAASPGLPVTQLNCHPFQWDRFAFMHNGFIDGFQQIVRTMRESLSEHAYHLVRGSTDSEHLFGVFIDHHEATDDACDPLERMAAAMTQTIATHEAMKRDHGVEAASLLNLALTDGQRAVVTRYASNGCEPNSLYVNHGRSYVCEDGVCRMVDDARPRAAVIVASEPLSSDPGWEPVTSGHMVMIDASLHVESKPIAV